MITDSANFEDFSEKNFDLNNQEDWQKLKDTMAEIFKRDEYSADFSKYIGGISNTYYLEWFSRIVAHIKVSGKGGISTEKIDVGEMVDNVNLTSDGSKTWLLQQQADPFQMPIIIWREGQRQSVIDGNNRLVLARRLGIKSLPALIISTGDDINETPDTELVNDEMTEHVERAKLMEAEHKEILDISLFLEYYIKEYDFPQLYKNWTVDYMLAFLGSASLALTEDLADQFKLALNQSPNLTQDDKQKLLELVNEALSLRNISVEFDLSARVSQISEHMNVVSVRMARQAFEYLNIDSHGQIARLKELAKETASRRQILLEDVMSLTSTYSKNELVSAHFGSKSSTRMVVSTDAKGDTPYLVRSNLGFRNISVVAGDSFKHPKWEDTRFMAMSLLAKLNDFLFNTDLSKLNHFYINIILMRFFTIWAVIHAPVDGSGRLSGDLDQLVHLVVKELKPDFKFYPISLTGYRLGFNLETFMGDVTDELCWQIMADFLRELVRTYPWYIERVNKKEGFNIDENVTAEYLKQNPQIRTKMLRANKFDDGYNFDDYDDVYYACCKRCMVGFTDTFLDITNQNFKNIDEQEKWLLSELPLGQNQHYETITPLPDTPAANKLLDLLDEIVGQGNVENAALKEIIKELNRPDVIEVLRNNRAYLNVAVWALYDRYMNLKENQINKGYSLFSNPIDELAQYNSVTFNTVSDTKAQKYLSRLVRELNKVV